jgi:predicted metal-binding membrane protein
VESGLSLRRSTALAAVVLGGALVAWIVTVQRMRGMDAGPGTDLGALGWFIGIWVTMMAAMMLPSVAPTVMVFARLRRDASAIVFALGYLLAWALCGLAAYGIYRALRSASPSFVAWDRSGPLLAGGALIAAGLYQLTPLKTACLRHCRSPVGLLMRGPRGSAGALWTGAEHGVVCIGCCIGLMLALFALGVMSIFWMLIVGVAILVEKTLAHGETLARVFALALIALGLWVAVWPGSVVGLTQPDHTPMGMPGMSMQP